MEVSRIQKFAAAAIGAAVMAGCATPNSMYGSNTQVVNRPENSGVKQYGSEACRSADVEVIPAQSYYQNRGYYAQRYSGFNRLFAQNQTFRNAVMVKDETSGQQFLLMSERSESSWGKVIGVGAGVTATASGNRRGYGYRGNNVRDAGKTLIGVAVGAFVGGLADDAVNTRAREAFDRCRLDVAQGAYNTAPAYDYQSVKPR